MLRWNFSSRARELSGADVLVISIPKSGRTWLRAFLCAYFCKKTGHHFTLEAERYGDPQIPRIVYSHDIFEQRTKARWWDKLRGKYLVPASELRRARVILLARDPRDAFVSLHAQLTRRTRETDESLKGKAITELLRDPDYGIES
ncbi:MAG: sulfotransferase domain-containing protein, partial [Chthoniobacterales bacterium]